MKKRPKVGVGVFIKKGNKILLGFRKGSNDPGTWCPPGGHVEWNESIERAAVRETKEETGITITNLKQGPYINDINPNEKKHYITLYIIADYKSGEPNVTEPDRFVKWQWFSWEKLPKPLFYCTRNFIKHGHNPFKL